MTDHALGYNERMVLHLVEFLVKAIFIIVPSYNLVRFVQYDFSTGKTIDSFIYCLCLARTVQVLQKCSTLN